MLQRFKVSGDLAENVYAVSAMADTGGKLVADLMLGA